MARCSSSPDSLGPFRRRARIRRIVRLLPWVLVGILLVLLFVGAILWMSSGRGHQGTGDAAAALPCPQLLLACPSPTALTPREIRMPMLVRPIAVIAMLAPMMAMLARIGCRSSPDLPGAMCWRRWCRSFAHDDTRLLGSHGVQHSLIRGDQDP
jgi:hypothetical protein